jgi:hypothetical protein
MSLVGRYQALAKSLEITFCPLCKMVQQFADLLMRSPVQLEDKFGL